MRCDTVPNGDVCKYDSSTGLWEQVATSGSIPPVCAFAMQILFFFLLSWKKRVSITFFFFLHFELNIYIYFRYRQLPMN